MRYAIVCVGTSWGGLAALRTLVRELGEGFPLPLVVVQHRHRDSDTLLVHLLQDCTTLPVAEVEDKDPLEPGRIHIAPPDYHLLLEDGHFALSTDPPVRFSRPSIDVTFASAADDFGARTIGVVLTGANADGADGLRRIVAAGGTALVQDPATAESPTMPAAALRAVPDARSLSLQGIAGQLREMVAEPDPSRAGREARRLPPPPVERPRPETR